MFLASCSVIEDRSVCPCWLKVTYDECEEMTGDIRYFIWNSEDFLVQGKEDIATGPHMYSTPRGSISYAGSFGIPDLFVSDGLYTLVDNQEAAEFYAYWHNDIQMVDDYVQTSVKPRKQFANLRIDFTEDISDRYRDIVCEIASTSAGVNLRTLQAVKGLYFLNKEPDSNGQFNFNISRQGFGDLTLTVLEKGERLNVYSLSKILDDAGYDWTAPALKNASITLSLTRQDVSVELGDWEDGGEFDQGL